MADAVNQSTLKQVLVPAAAAAVVVILIGALVYNSNFTKPGGGDGKAAGAPGEPVASAVTDNSDEGMASFDKVAAPDSPDWQDYGDGLKGYDVREGDGPACPKGATVTIHYSGWLLNGTQFDSSRTRGEPANFPLGNLVAGWQAGIPGMKKGGIRRLLIPYTLAYGEAGRPPSIPPKATLIFEIKMLGFQG